MIERDFVFQLRLHNALLYKGEMCFVESISLDSNDESEPYINLFANGKTIEYIVPHHQSEGVLKPIPLTPEILEKAGFEKINHIHGYSFHSFKRKKGDNMPSISVYERKTEVNGYSYFHITYLHQLMNLFYALTGQELEITL